MAIKTVSWASASISCGVCTTDCSAESFLVDGRFLRRFHVCADCFRKGGVEYSQASHCRNGVELGDVSGPNSEAAAAAAAVAADTADADADANADADPGEFCICRREWDGVSPMICCDRCEEWFHPTCIGMQAELYKQFFVDADHEWFCRECSADSDCSSAVAGPEVHELGSVAGSNRSGVQGAHLNPLGLFLNPLGLFLRTSIPSI
jgi:hypothetical protein